MLRVLCMMLVTLLIVINSGSDALAEKRVALVIGNSGYKAVTALQNPANDSADIARALEALDFEVELVSDLTFDKMRRSLRSFSKRASGADVALVFYAGHGIEVDGQNYLIPVDARLESSDDVDYEALPLNLVMGSLNGAKKLKLVLLDACRNNPFIAGMKTSGAKRAIGRGLARVEPSVGTLVGFAAKEGTTASDGDGRNSPYTKALLEHLDEPGLEINLLFRKVRDSVLSQTNGEQEPFTYGSLPGRQLYLKDGSQPAKPVATGAIPSSIKLSEAGQVWVATQATRSVAVLEAFEKSYAGTPYAALARARIEELKAVSAKTQAPAPALSNVKPAASNSSAGPKPPEPAEQRVAAVEPQPRQQVAKPPRFASEGELVRAIQKALNDHRCNAGSVPTASGAGRACRGRWPVCEARQAEPGHRSKLKDLLDAIEGKSGKACPLVCGARYQKKGDECVLKTCKKGEKLDRRGKCHAPRSCPIRLVRARSEHVAIGNMVRRAGAFEKLPWPSGYHLGFCDGRRLGRGGASGHE
jgi:uncharacterized caspase-like protein